MGRSRFADDNRASCRTLLALIGDHLPSIRPTIEEAVRSAAGVWGKMPQCNERFGLQCSPKRQQRFGGLKKGRRENGIKQRKNAHGSIAGQRASRDQRRMSRVSKRSARYRELASDDGRGNPQFSILAGLGPDGQWSIGHVTNFV